MTWLRHSFQKLPRWLAHEYFFWTIGLWLVLSAGWIALTGRYPMAFDEDFHLGLIRLYADHGLPWWSAHPAGGDAYGALARDPSYLYHYLMSFPYRLVSWLTDNQTIQVLILRATSLAFFASSLPLYRRLLLKTGASRAIVHSSLAIMVLVPVVPLLAAQINYDNLIMPLTALTLLAVLQVAEDIRAGRWNLRHLLATAALMIFSSLVKYAFLPLALGALLFLAIQIRQVYARHGAAAPRRPPALLATIWRQRSIGNGVLLGLVLLLSGLAVERYGINLLRYHDPVPDCAAVLTVEHCSAYGPWVRDYNLAANKGDFKPQPLGYSYSWLRGMWLRSVFAVDGPGTMFQTRGPLWTPAFGILALAAGSVLAISWYGRRVWRRYDSSVLNLLMLATVVYLVVLFATGFQLYAHAGKPVAINGRYLVSVLPFIILIAALAVNQGLQRRPKWRAGLLTLSLVSLLWGGSSLTYILRSNDAWYWPSPVVRAANHAVQRTLGPITPGNNYPNKFLPN